MKAFLFVWIVWGGVSSAMADVLFLPVPAPDVVILGEIHDNPDHHHVQADAVGRLNPSAIVFEMLTQVQAAEATPQRRRDEAALEQALKWDQSGWPDFSMYFPIFKAAGTAAIYGGAVPREDARKVIKDGLAQSFGPEAEMFGLTQPLAVQEQQAREALQMAVHCDALPENMLPRMVSVQRLRDARLAEAVLTALAEHGPPIAVITGNGHARKDWGVPHYLNRVRPDLEVFSVGMAEGGQEPEGGFDAVVMGFAGPKREDPCLAFSK